MELKIVIDKTCQERIEIFAREKNDTVKQIEQIVLGKNDEIFGFLDREAVRLDLDEVYCFFSDGNKVYLKTENKNYAVRQRIYELEETLPSNFIKLNQSCIANIKKIKKFDTSISGTLKVVFKNGYIDYVSRRRIKAVKERLGL